MAFAYDGRHDARIPAGQTNARRDPPSSPTKLFQTGRMMRLAASLICGKGTILTLCALQEFGVEPVVVATHRVMNFPLAEQLFGPHPGVELVAREDLRQAPPDLRGNPPVGDELTAAWHFVISGLAMIDRVNWDGANLADMFRLYVRYVAFWSERMDALAPDVCWFDGVPHQAQDWALYQVCQQKGIPTFSVAMTLYDNRPVIHRDLAEAPIRVDLDSQALVQTGDATVGSAYLERVVGPLVDADALSSQRGLAELRSAGIERLLRSLRRAWRPLKHSYPIMVPAWPRRTFVRSLSRLHDRYRVAKCAKRLLKLPSVLEPASHLRIFFPLPFPTRNDERPTGNAAFRSDLGDPRARQRGSSRRRSYRQGAPANAAMEVFLGPRPQCCVL